MSKLLSKYDLKLLISEGDDKKVINKLLEIAPTQDNETCNLILTLSATYKKFQQNLAMGVVTNESRRILINEINMRMLMIIDQIDFEKPNTPKESDSQKQKRENLEAEFRAQQQKLQEEIQREKTEKEHLQNQIRALESHQKTATQDSEAKSKQAQQALIQEREEKRKLEERLQQLQIRNEERQKLEELDKLGMALHNAKINNTPPPTLKSPQSTKSSIKKWALWISAILLACCLVWYFNSFQKEQVGEEINWTGDWELTMFEQSKQGNEIKTTGNMSLFSENGQLVGKAITQLQMGLPDSLIFTKIHLSSNGKTLKGNWQSGRIQAFNGTFEFNLAANQQSFTGFKIRRFPNKPDTRIRWMGVKIE